MKDQDKIKRQLIDELAKLRQRIRRLEKSESRHKAAEKSLRESEEKYRTIIDSIDEGYYEVDLAGKFTFFNDSLCRILGYSRDELMGMNNRQYMDEKSGKKAFQIFNKVYKTGIPYKAVDFQIVRKDEVKKYGEISVSLIKDSRNKPIGFRGFVHDITERKRAEEKIKASLKEKEVLLQEIHHRVKNNLQIMVSLFRLQSEKIRSKKMQEIFKQSQNRIRSMALIHEKLYKSKDFTRVDFAHYIKSLTEHLFNTYRVSSNIVRLRTDVRDVFLDINRAIPCGLVINELVSNSLKHGFPEGKRGEICVKFHSDREGKYSLIVSDNGIGIPKELDIYKTETLGLKLVILLTEQLKGNIELDKKGGTKFKITL